jgi:hypothetical protein
MATELRSLAKIFNNRFLRIPDYQRGLSGSSTISGQISNGWQQPTGYIIAELL